MTLEKYTEILHDCHSAEPSIITPDVIESMYKFMNIEQYPIDDYICIGIPDEESGYFNVTLFWVAPHLRNKGIGTQLLNKINMSHGMVVDVRSTAMHKLCKSLGYSQSTEYVIDGEIMPLHGGDIYYYKEIT